jgi:hypothetical protein
VTGGNYNYDQVDQLTAALAAQDAVIADLTTRLQACDPTFSPDPEPPADEDCEPCDPRELKKQLELNESYFAGHHDTLNGLKAKAVRALFECHGLGAKWQELCNLQLINANIASVHVAYANYCYQICCLGDQGAMQQDLRDVLEACLNTPGIDPQITGWINAVIGNVTDTAP